MSPITKYAVQYSLLPRHSAQDVGVLFGAALDQWHAKKRLAVPPLTWETPASGRLDNGILYRWAPYNENGEAIADYTLRHLDPTDPRLSWVTRFSYLARRETSSTSPYAGPVRHFLTAEVMLEGPELLARQRTTGRPGLIPMLDDVFAIGDGDLEFLKTARNVPRKGVGDFVQYMLADPKRRFPIIVLSEQRDRGFLLDPAIMARQYFAVGHVYTLGWREALTLSSEVGSRLSVFNGAMRVYFPGFRTASNPSDHPLVPAHRFESASFRGRLVAAIAEETVKHFAEVELPSAELSERRVLAYDAARYQMAQQLKAAVPAEDISKYQQLVEAYEGETLEARRQLDQANAKIAELEKKVAALKHALATVRGSAEKEDSALQDLMAEEPPANAYEAVLRASRATEDALYILMSAYESAAESGYTQPDVILDYLTTMADIARRRRAGALGMNLRDAFKDKGIDYAPKNAENTRGSLRAQYRFSEGDGEWLCEEHLRRGSDPALGLRIYFTSETNDGRFVVGHIGRHLDTNTTS
jgi:hypothetical protein